MDSLSWTDYYASYEVLESYEDLQLKYVKTRAELAAATEKLFEIEKDLEAQTFLTIQQQNKLIGNELLIGQYKDVVQQIYLVASDSLITRVAACRRIYALVNEMKKAEDKDKIWSN